MDEHPPHSSAPADGAPPNSSPPTNAPADATDPHADAPVRPAGRIEGIDAARALAIIGMVMVHFGPTRPGEGLLARLYGATHGRASILFVVLAGIGVSLLAGNRTPARQRSAAAKLVFRAALLLPLGLALQELDTNVLVILQYYALYFLFAAAVAPLGDRTVLALSGALFAAGPVAYVALGMARPGWFAAGGAAAWTDEPAQIARDLLLTGSYPVITWLGPVVFGVWLGRRDLRSVATRVRLLVGGTAAAVAGYGGSSLLLARYGEPAAASGWGQLMAAEAHSQMPLWLVGATGLATAVLGACLLLATWLPRLLWPLVATGQLALTVYVGHLLVLAAAPDLLQADTVEGAIRTVAAFTAVTAAVCAAWRMVFSRGPLEALLRLPWWSWRRLTSA